MRLNNTSNTIALINGKVETSVVNSETAIYIKDGIIELLGTDKEILTACETDTTVLDMKGKSIYPGLIDSHIHLLSTGRDIYSRENKLHYPYKEEEIKEWYEKVKIEILKNGITSVQTDDSDIFESSKQAVDFYKMLAEEKEIPFRITYQLRIKNEQQLKDYIKSGIFETDIYNFKVGAIVVKVDGEISERTAALKEGYSDFLGLKGEMLISSETLIAIITLAEQIPCQIIFDAQGDRAIEEIIKAIATVRKDKGEESTIYHRIRNLKIGSPQIYKTMKKYGLMVEITPANIIEDSKIMIKKVGAERSRENNALKTVLKEKIVLGVGSDSPIHPISPFLNMRYMIQRQDLNNEPRFGWMPAERLTLEEAIETYTLNNAELCGDKNKKGTISKGAYADVTVFITETAENEEIDITKMKVGLTIIDGKIRYIK
ncbi:MAG: amidohydrolase family protein [Synergistaceae bacterium]